MNLLANNVIIKYQIATYVQVNNAISAKIIIIQKIIIVFQIARLIFSFVVHAISLIREHVKRVYKDLICKIRYALILAQNKNKIIYVN